MTIDESNGRTLRLPMAGVSLLYLAIPVGLFLLRWVRPEFGVVSALLLAVGVGFLFRQSTVRIPLRTLGLCALLAFGVCAVSGVGGVGLQNWDWDKHNALLHDLIRIPGAVRYSDHGDPALAGPLTYYVAWYLPAAAVGQALGWTAANVALFAWTWLGISIAFLWFALLTETKGVVGPLFLLFFSGLDVLGAITNGQNPVGLSNIEFHHWAGFAQYSENLALINWVPHHAIPMWLTSSIVFHEIEAEKGTLRFAAWALLPLWSPWTAIGLAPFLLLGRSWRPSLGVIGVVIGALPITALYIASSRGNVVRAWGWEGMAGFQFPGHYLRFVLLEFLVFGVLVWRILRPVGRDRFLLGLGIALLLVIPLLKVGVSNDLAMRGSLPALYLLALFAFRAAVSVPGRLRTALWVCLAVGALSPLHELVYSVSHYRFGPPAESELRPLPYTDGRRYAVQFLGDERKLFWSLLAR